MARGRSERVAFVPTAEDRARYIDWWILESGLELDELRELAQMIWAPSELTEDRLGGHRIDSAALEPMFA